MAEVEHDQAAAPAPAAAAPIAGAAVGHPLLGLQRSAGNAAVGAMLQTKLSVGRADDPAEREADRVAADVMRTLNGGGDAPPVRRSSGGHDELGGQDVSPDVQSRIQGSSGRSMDAGTLSRMESAFGASFSNVRIHDGAEADTLSRSLQAEAFTTGNDVFFRKGNYDPGSSGGQELLAHELTHVVQQGGAGTATRRIRRFVTKEQFAERTDEGMFTAKGPAQKEIEKQLLAYSKLGEVVKRPKGAKPHPSGVNCDVLLKPEQYDQALALLKQMKQVAELWLASKTKETTDKDTGKVTAKIDPSRAKRGAGMAWFLMACDGEIQRLEVMKANAASQPGGLAKQADTTVDSSGMQKLKEKYTGGLGTGLSTAGTILGKAIANDGDSTEFEFDMKIPVAPGVFVGAILRFEGSRKAGNTEVGVEAMFQAGGTLAVVNIAGALGGYFKASAKTAEGAMKLISYGFYRRCVESDVIPASLSNSIWGGEQSSREVADKWSREVEETELTNDDSYVETGGVAELNAEADFGKAGGVSGAAKASTGKRHDKKSLDKTKGGAGEKNETNILAGEKKTGRSVHALEFSAKGNVLGHLAGDVKFHLDWRDSLDGKGAEFDGLSVQFRASGRMPAAGLDGAIAGLVGSFVKTLVTIFSKQFQQAEATDMLKKMAVPSLTLAKASTEVTLQSLMDVGVSEAIKANTLDKIFTPAPKPAPGAPAPTGPTSESNIGLELALLHEKGVSSSSTTFEIRHLTALDAKVPSLLKVELTRRSRILGWQNAGSGWTLLRG
jgi:hypothetical protein